MSTGQLSVVEPVRGGYAFAPHLLPGAVVSAVGYATAGPGGQLHRGLPSPYLTFIFALDAPVVSGTTPLEATGDRAARNNIVIAGLHREPTYVVQPAAELGIQLAVHPLASRSLFGLPAARVPWEVTEGSDLLGPDADRVRERLAEQTSWATRFEVLGHYLRGLEASRRPATVRPELSEAWDWLARRRGRGSMDALARHLYVSPRQLRTLFDREVGISPKQVSRLMRFDSARQLLATAVAARQRLTLGDLATRSGYFDQAHLDKEFRGFAAVSPSQWVNEESRNLQAAGPPTLGD